MTFDAIIRGFAFAGIGSAIILFVIYLWLKRK